MVETNQVPFAYRLIFAFVDPMFCMLGLYLHLFEPMETLKGYSPYAKNPPGAEAIHLLDSMAGFFAMLAVIEGVLLRVRPNDVTVWRIVQAGASLLDILMVWGAIRAMTTEGRFDISDWRGDDYRLVVGNAAMGFARILCALGVGMGGGAKSKKA